MYLPPPSASVRRWSCEFMPASPTKTHRPGRHPRRSSFTLATVVMSFVSPENTHERTGSPSRVTARPTTICGASPRPFFECPRLRNASYSRRLRRSAASSSSSISKCNEVVS